MNPETANIQPAHTLEIGTRIKLGGNDLTIAHVINYGDWTELFFTWPMWNPLTEKWIQKFGCHFGFCIEVLEK